MKKYYYQPGGVVGSIRLSILIILIAIAYSAQLDTTTLNYVTPTLLIVAVIYCFIMYKRTYITFSDDVMDIYGISKNSTYKLTNADIAKVDSSTYYLKIYTTNSSLQTDSIIIVGTKKVIKEVNDKLKSKEETNK